jgi:tRNA(fMet)-specific endonuclease VapC
MSLLLLDTTFLVEAERSAQILEAVIGDDDDVAIAAITVAELLVEVKLASAKWHDRRRDYVEDILTSIPVIAYDSTVAVEHAELLTAVRAAGRPRGAHDLIIAATARATGRTVVSADTLAFSDLPAVEVKTHRPA